MAQHGRRGPLVGWACRPWLALLLGVALCRAEPNMTHCKQDCGADSLAEACFTEHCQPDGHVSSKVSALSGGRVRAAFE